MANKRLTATAGMVALATLSGCVTTGGPRLDIVGPRGGSQPVIASLSSGPYQPSSEAIGVDKDVDANRVQGMGLVPAPELEAYLNDRLEAIRGAVGITGMPGSVHITANPGLKANTTADGNMFISMGWIQTLENEDQVIALLGHEFCHAAFKHHDSDIAGKLGRRLHDAGAIVAGIQNQLDTKGQSQGLTAGAQKNLQKVQLLIMVTEQVIVPAWNRNQETECDRFSTDLAVKMGYSLDMGISTVLDKLQTWDASTAATRQSELQQLSKQQQTDPNAALQAGLKQLINSLKEDHPDTDARIKDIAAYREKYYPDALPVKARKENWQKVVGKGQTKTILANYKATFEVEDLIRQRQVKEALIKGKMAISGPTADHALPLYRYALALDAAGESKKAGEMFERSTRAKEPALPPYADRARYLESTGQATKALEVMETAYKRFNEPPNLLPQLIGLYRKNGKKDEQNKLFMTCRFKNPEYGDQCAQANNPT